MSKEIPGEAVRVILYRFKDDEIQFYLAQRPDWSKKEAEKHQLIGGAVGEWEFPLPAIIREMCEELEQFSEESERDYEKLWHQLGAWGKHTDLETGWVTNSFFLCLNDLLGKILDDTELNLDTDEMDQADWFSLEKLKTLAIAFNHSEIVGSFIVSILKLDDPFAKAKE